MGERKEGGRTRKGRWGGEGCEGDRREREALLPDLSHTVRKRVWTLLHS